MEIDLSGKTVTQALSTFKSSLKALALEPDSSTEKTKTAVFRLDNETVKLNVLQHASKHNIECHSKRQGLFWLIKAKIPVVKAPIELDPEKPVIPNVPRMFNEWWIIQSDQVGHKDHILGNALQLELVRKLLNQPAGIFFVHRGVLLFNDPVLRAESSQKGPAGLWACPASMDFYQVHAPFLSQRTYTDFLIDHRKSKLIFT